MFSTENLRHRHRTMDRSMVPIGGKFIEGREYAKIDGVSEAIRSAYNFSQVNILQSNVIKLNLTCFVALEVYSSG